MLEEKYIDKERIKRIAQERKILHVRIPSKVFKELQRRHLFTNIDDVVSELLIQYFDLDSSGE